MADPQKLVQVDDGVIAFPSDMPDSHISAVIRNHRAKKLSPLTTEESEHERQLKPAQPLGTAIPDWLKEPIPVTSRKIDRAINRSLGLPEISPLEKQEQAAREAFDKAHPITGGIMQGASNFAKGLLTPANIALMLTAPQSKLLSAYFAFQAAKGSYRNAQEAEKAFKEGKNKDAAQYATESLLGLGVAGVAGTHAVKGTAVNAEALRPSGPPQVEGEFKAVPWKSSELAPTRPEVKPVEAAANIVRTPMKPLSIPEINDLVNQVKAIKPPAPPKTGWEDFNFRIETGSKPIPGGDVPERTPEGDPILYHGTSAEAAEKIKKEGFKSDNLGYVGFGTRPGAVGVFRLLQGGKTGRILRFVLDSDWLKNNTRIVNEGGHKNLYLIQAGKAIPLNTRTGKEAIPRAAIKRIEDVTDDYLNGKLTPPPAPFVPTAPTQPAPVAPQAPAVPTPVQPAPVAALQDRRTNPELRKRISEMSPDEMRKLLTTSDVVDLPNKRMFQEHEQEHPSPAVGRSDADGLKAFNDRFGYDKGNELLNAKAEALKEAGLDAYHEKGDEFLYRGNSEQDIQQKLEKAREILRNKVFDVTLDDGTHLQLKGVDFSYGTGKNLREAEFRQHLHKTAREAAGERKRGELAGVTQVGPQAGSQRQEGVAPIRAAAVQPPATPEITERNKAFQALADTQRDKPEDAMRDVQMHTLGAGVWGDALEHVGDLTHRMTEHPEWQDYYSGYGNVKDKIDRKHFALTRGPGWIPFEDEFRQQLKSNYDYRVAHGQESRPFLEVQKELFALGDKYAEEHAKLPVYNRVQELARDAAVALGHRQFDAARAKLSELKAITDKGKEAWEAEASKYDPNYENKPNVQAERTAEGKVKMGADPAALGKILGSSLYRSENTRVITKELIQNAMDAVRDSAGDNSVTAEIFDRTYPPALTGKVVPHPDPSNTGYLAIQKPDGTYILESEGYGAGKPIAFHPDQTYDIRRTMRDFFPPNPEGSKALRITDTGKGMTKNELETVFTDLGASGKRESAEASGGFGLAKAAPLMMSKKLEVSTVVNENGKLTRHSFTATPEDLLGAGVDIKSEVLPPNSAPTGTTVTSVLPDEADLWQASSFLDSTRLSLRPPGTLKVFQSGQDITPNHDNTINTTPLDTRTIPGSILDLYISNEKTSHPTGKYGTLTVEVHNNGIYQFNTSVGVPEGIRGLPKRTAIDIKATVQEGDPDYPFTANREDLKGNKLQGEINSFVKEKVIAPIVEAHNAKIQTMYWNFPLLNGFLPIFDSGTRFTPEELQEIMSNPAVKEIAESIFDITTAARQLLENAGEKHYEMMGLGKVKRIGIVFSSHVHGVHITNPTDKTRATIFINPFDDSENTPDEYASLMWHTIQHELVHDEVSGHNESFTTGFKNVSRALGSMNIRALTELRNKYADPNDITRVRQDFDRAFHIYRNSRTRPESTPDIFGGEESRTGLDRPEGKEDRGESLRPSGEGIVPVNASQRPTDEQLEQQYPVLKKGKIVDGRVVRQYIPNQSSIDASADDPTVLPGIREVQMSEFPAPPEINSRTKKLAEEIEQSGEINPLIVMVEKEGPYILEGGHRYDALKILGAKSFPAMVVIAEETFDDLVQPLTSSKH